MDSKTKLFCLEAEYKYQKMKTSILELKCENRTIPITVERKKIKTVRLRVYPECIVKISAPYSVTEEFLTDFIIKRQKWIEEKLDYFANAKRQASENGASVRMLGEDFTLSVREGREYIYKEGQTIYISSSDTQNHEKLMTLFDMWWRDESMKILKQYVDALYPIIQKYGIPYPSIYLRKMKTLWGSCSVRKNKVTFNQYLTKAKPECVEYVVLHELAHFIHPNHSKNFYDFLSIYMPDWKERKKVLNTENYF